MLAWGISRTILLASLRLKGTFVFGFLVCLGESFFRLTCPILPRICSILHHGWFTSLCKPWLPCALQDRSAGLLILVSPRIWMWQRKFLFYFWSSWADTAKKLTRKANCRSQLYKVMRWLDSRSLSWILAAHSVPFGISQLLLGLSLMRPIRLWGTRKAFSLGHIIVQSEIQLCKLTTSRVEH